jgi:hypothetical protein
MGHKWPFLNEDQSQTCPLERMKKKNSQKLVAVLSQA